MFGARSFKELLVASTKRGDILFALGIILMLVILILPMPAWLLDIALALSITMACIVLMTAIFIEKPTEFSAFPLVLLITTMYRLSLNLASTRLILSRGYLGPDAAGEVIEAFGGFIMGNSFVIGVIVFAILVIVNFVVITKRFRPYCRSCRAFCLGCHARQADGHRCRPVFRIDYRRRSPCPS